MNAHIIVKSDLTFNRVQFHDKSDMLSLTDLYLKSGGKFAIRQKIAERQGHRNLRLVGQN